MSCWRVVVSCVPSLGRPKCGSVGVSSPRRHLLTLERNPSIETINFLVSAPSHHCPQLSWIPQWWLQFSDSCSLCQKRSTICEWWELRSAPNQSQSYLISSGKHPNSMTQQMLVVVHVSAEFELKCSLVGIYFEKFLFQITDNSSFVRINIVYQQAASLHVHIASYCILLVAAYSRSRDK